MLFALQSYVPFQQITSLVRAFLQSFSEQDATNTSQQTTTTATLFIKGNSRYEFEDWCGPNGTDTNWLDSFFVWKRIDDPERYFLSDFCLIVPTASEFFFREAAAQGVNPQAFAKGNRYRRSFC